MLNSINKLPFPVLSLLLILLLGWVLGFLAGIFLDAPKKKDQHNQIKADSLIEKSNIKLDIKKGETQQEKLHTTKETALLINNIFLVFFLMSSSHKNANILLVIKIS